MIIENTNEVIKSISNDIALIDTAELSKSEQIKLSTLKALELIAVNLAVIADRLE